MTQKTDLTPEEIHFQEYIRGNRILIVDPCSVSRASIAGSLSRLGVPTAFCQLASSFSDAEQALQEHSPKMVLCEYELGSRSGLDLLQDLRKNAERFQDSVFVLVTSNASQSAIAQAAEEDVDAYIIKPFTMKKLRESILKVVSQKTHPSDYSLEIKKGKKLLEKGFFDQAQITFDEAAALSSRPTLAYYYLGMTSTHQEELKQAKKSFETGLKINQIHYKCLVGLFDHFMQQKQYFEAYTTVKRIARIFPANPQRLASVVQLAIMTKSYSDVERYYQNFIELDYRTEILGRTVCAALIICGRHYLDRKIPEKALQLFKKVIVTGKRNEKMLREIVHALTDAGFYSEAQEILKEFPPEKRWSTDYRVSELLIELEILSPSSVVERCRELLANEVQDPTVYRLLIEAAVRRDMIDYAEEMIRAASKRWPKMTTAFESLMVVTEEDLQAA